MDPDLVVQLQASTWRFTRGLERAQRELLTLTLLALPSGALVTAWWDS